MRENWEEGGDNMAVEVERKQPSWISRKSTREMFWSIFLYTVMVFGAIAILIPFLWMLTTGLKPEGRAFEWPPIWYA